MYVNFTIFVKPQITMQIKRVAIYIDSRSPIAQIKLNILYSSKFLAILSRTGNSRSKEMVSLLQIAFGTTDNEELKERIGYAASAYVDIKKESKKNVGLGSVISRVCKIAVKKGIDKKIIEINNIS